MRFYFAAPFSYGERLRDLARFIDNIFDGPRQCWTTASWIYIPTGTRAKNHLEAANYALLDLENVDACDVLIMFNPEDGSQSPGRNVEYGYAVAKGKQIWLVGPKTSVFSYLPGIRYFKDEEDVKQYLTVLGDDLLCPYEAKRP